MNRPFVIDTRRIYNPDEMKSINYFAIGYGNTVTNYDLNVKFRKKVGESIFRLTPGIYNI